MAGATRAMQAVNASPSMAHITQTLAEFDKQNQMMEMTDDLLDDLLDDSEGEEEADEIVDQVFEEIGLDLNEKLVAAPSTRVRGQQQQQREADAEEDATDAEAEALLRQLAV
jgi:charged multivesicular body protein 2A